MRTIRIFSAVFFGALLAYSCSRLFAKNDCCGQSCETSRGKRMTRKADHKINRLFLKRYSGYALSGEVSKEEFDSVLEAARWAPSSYNMQPWRFIYGKKGTAAFDKLFDLMVDFNKQWAQNADYLVLIVSDSSTPWNEQPNRTHSFDTGAAWQSMALQAADLGLIAHGMAGFDFEKARAAFEIPERWTVQAMAAIGRPGSEEQLPEEMRDRNAKQKEGARKSIEEIAWDGEFRK